MNSDLKYIFLGAYIGLVIIAFLSFFNVVYNMGYYEAHLERDGHLYAVKKRTITKGNILEYPFIDEREQSTKTGDCNSIQQSGITKTQETKE